jgi:hypothetical protein
VSCKTDNNSYKLSGIVTFNDTVVENIEVNLNGVTTTTDANGKYEITSNSKIGVFQIISDTFHNNYRELDLNETKTLDVKLYNKGIIMGHLTDELNTPLNGIVISFANINTTTDSDGYYEFEDVPEKNDYISISNDNYIPLKQLILKTEFKNSFISNKDLFIRGCITIKGLVVDSNANPIQNAKITIGANSIYSDETGHFEFKHIPRIDGYIGVLITHEGYEDTLKSVLANHNTEAQVEMTVKLPKGGN